MNLFQKKLKIILSIFFIVIFCGANLTAMPYIFNLVIEASEETTESDFGLKNQQTSIFLNLLHQTLRNSSPNDYVSVSWFGGNDDFFHTPFYNCTDQSRLNELIYVLENARHPQFKGSAIYSSALNSALQSQQYGQTLSGDYVSVIFLVISGPDSGSPDRNRQIFQEYFADNQKCLLLVIGVGPEADVEPYRSYAKFVTKVNSYSSLETTMSDIFRNVIISE